jgi:hypothetical protein
MSNVIIYAQKENTDDYIACEVNEDHELKVNVGNTVEANITNDSIDVEIKTITNSTYGIKKALDTANYEAIKAVDKSNNNIESLNLVKETINTVSYNNLRVHDNKNFDKLDEINTILEDLTFTGTELETIISNTTSSIVVYGNDGVDNQPLFVDSNGFISTYFIENKHDQIIYDFQISKDGRCYQSTLTNWSKNPYSIENGWFFQNKNATSAYLWYYTNGNIDGSLPQQEFPLQSNIKYNELDVFYHIIALYNTTTYDKLNFIIYSKPTGNNDYIPLICHSMWIFTIPANAVLNTGEPVLFYFGLQSRIKTVDPEVRRVQLQLSQTFGDANGNEIIRNMRIQTLHTAPTNSIEMLVMECALYHKNIGLLEYYFDNSEKRLNEEALNNLNFTTIGNVKYLNVEDTQSKIVLDDIKINTDNLTAIKTNTDNLTAIKTNTDNLTAIKTNTDNLTAIKTNTDNLTAIKTNTDNLTAIKTNTDNLTAIKTNTDKLANLSYTTTTNLLKVSVDNNVTINNNDTNAMIIKPQTIFDSNNTFKSSVYDANGVAITSSTPTTLTNTLDTTSILYTKTGASTIAPLTSSSIAGGIQALDVNLAGGSIAIGNVNIKDSNNNPIVAQTTPSNVAGSLKTVLMGSTNNTIIGDTNASPHGTTKSGLNNFIVNSYSLPVICGGFDGTNTQGFKTTAQGSQYVALDTANNTIKIASTDNTIKLSQTSTDNTIKIASTDNTIKLSQTSTDNTIKIASTDNTIKFSQTSNDNNIKITDTGGGDIATVSKPTTFAGTILTRGLDTIAYLSARDVYNDNYDNLTFTNSLNPTPSNLYRALDTYIRNPSTTNNYSQSGLNMYQIYPKKIYCNFGGYNGSATANLVYGGPTSNSMTPSTINFNSVSTLYYWVQTNVSSRKYLFTYVDLNNTIQSGTITAGGTGYNPLLGTVGAPIAMRSLLTFKSVDYIPVAVNVNIVIATSTATPTTNANCIAGLTYHSSFNGAIVVPNGYVGYLTGFSFFSNTACSFNYIKYYTGADAGQSTGITGRTTLAQWNNASNFTVSQGGQPIGGIIEAGEGVIMYKQSTSTDTYFMGTFVLEAI